VSDWSIDARDHMNTQPADGNLVQARYGETNLPVSMTIGGALVPFANPQEVTDVGQGPNFPGGVVIISSNSYNAMGFTPRDGTLIQGTAGGQSTPVAMMVGGARINFANPQEVIDAGYGQNWGQYVRGIPSRHFHGIPTTPRDGTLIQGTKGSTPVAAIVGGARVNFANPQEVIDTGYGTDWPSKVRGIPERAFNEIADQIPDLVLVQGTGGGQSTPVAQVIGGARVEFASPQEVVDSGFGENWRDRVRAVPTRVFQGLSTRLPDRTLVQHSNGGVAQIIGGARFAFANPQEVLDTGFGEDWGTKTRRIPDRAFTALPAAPADGTLLLGENGVLYKAVGGTLEKAGSCPETAVCGPALAVAPRTALANLTEYGPGARAWVDVNGDRKADFCRRVGEVNHESSRVACTLSTGRGYGETITSDVLDWGYIAGRGWADVTGDGKADYCRVVGTDNRKTAKVACTPSTGTGFGPTFLSDTLDAGEPTARTWADVNGDGKADYCRVRGAANHTDANVSCAVSTGTGFGAEVSSGNLDWGFHFGRAFTDVTGDGKADYCRVVGVENHTKAHVACTVSIGTGFGATRVSAPLDWGFGADRVWADVNDDRRSDYCRRVGGTGNQRISCTLSTQDGFGATFVSSALDWGHVGSRTWTDVSGDGKADFCRVRGGANHTDAFASCTLSTGSGFGLDSNSQNTDWGYPAGRAWVDFNGDGMTDFCRRVADVNPARSRVYCTVSTGGSFGAQHLSDALEPGHVD
jgi:hypothetical protein